MTRGDEIIRASEIAQYGRLVQGYLILHRLAVALLVLAALLLLAWLCLGTGR
jgi:hypothetical protein